MTSCEIRMLMPRSLIHLALEPSRKKEYDFKSWMGPRPNSENRPRMGSGSEAKHRKSLPNRRQQEPKGAARSAAALGGTEGAHCCSLFGKDFLCFASLPEPILGRFSEFGPRHVQDLESYTFFSHCQMETNQLIGAQLGPN